MHVQPVGIPEAAAPARRPVCGRLAVLVDNLLGRRLLKLTRLGREMQILARRMEHDVFPQAVGAGQAFCKVVLSFENEGSDVTAYYGHVSHALGPYDVLVRFLHGVGIHSMILDADLEYNQIQDLLEILWTIRRPLRGERPHLVDRLLGHRKLVEALNSQEGLHVSCADADLDTSERELTVRDTYCPLTFSRAVTAYMNRVSRFKDHRAFFFSAPRYALLVALVMLGSTLLVPFLSLPMWLVVGIDIALALAAAGVTLVVLEAIGAVQYDKEHQARELAARHAALLRAHGDIQLDLERARRIQSILVQDAAVSPFPEHVATACWFRPEMAVGGDYYDMKRMNGQSMALIVADVAGHGMSGAFVTGLIKTTFEIGFDRRHPAREFMCLLNRLLYRMTPEDSFAAIVFACYDVERRALNYTVAGHHPIPMVVRQANGEVEQLGDATSMIAGIAPETAYECRETLLEPGDKLIVCTDGIIDATNFEGERFDMERLNALLRSSAQLTAAQLRDSIADAVSQHSGDEPQNDDQTMLILQVLR